jgi:hypothetical protein
MNVVTIQEKLKDLTRIILLVITFSGVLSASGGKLSGRVTESETGDPVPYANIIILSVMQNGNEVSLPSPIGAVSDREGYYVILNIPPGIYTVKTSMVGYASVIVKEIKIDPDRTITLNTELRSESIEMGEVVVVAKKEVIKSDVSSTQELITADRIQTLPMIRVDEVLGKLKGIELTTSSDGYGLVIRGGKIRETDVRMDGVSLQDPRSGNSYLGFNTTAINEIQVLTGGFEAKYGGIRSGLLDVKTKDGSRDRFTASIKTTYTPANQFRFFGTNPYSNESWIYRIYAGEYAWSGVPSDVKVPVDLPQDWKGWGKVASPPEIKALDSLERLELWQLQHPQYSVAGQPDYVVEGTFTGPLPIPATTFMAGFKYENSQFTYPIGPRDAYIDYNGQIKLTTNLENMKFSVNGMFAKILSNTSGQNVNYDISQRFSYLNNNTRESVIRQASLISGSSFPNLYNKSRLQKFEQTYTMGSFKFTHIPMPDAYYTLELQVGHTGQDISPMLMDMSLDTLRNSFYMYSEVARRWYNFVSPSAGLPNGTTNPTTDGIRKFTMYGGHQWADSSYSYNYQLKGDFTWQANRFNELQAGFTAGIQDMQVYAGYWNQSSLLFTPNSWQYYKGTPLDIGFYVQDKLEFEGLVMNAGVRLDYFNPLKSMYDVGFPQDKDFKALYNDIYSGLEGGINSYEKWLLFRELLDSPPGWPTGGTKVQFNISPRLGIAFPITETSKMYFNYGHFYQRQASSILYNMKLDALATTIPSPDLNMAKTVQYEFGYEQVFLENFLFNIAAYYKDISNEPLLRTYIDYRETNQVSKYFPDSYRDVKGVELRLERNFGRFITFSSMYDYMIVSSGETGFSRIYEYLVKYRENAKRSAAQNIPQALPRANVNLNLHTPGDYGILFGNWIADIFFEWRDGGEVLINDDQTVISLQNWVEVVNYWNIDLKLSKEITLLNSSFEISLIVKNLTNNKWLSTINMSQAEYRDYKNAISDKGGKWGEYKPEHLAAVIENSWENVLFLNPRRIMLGFRVNL